MQFIMIYSGECVTTALPGRVCALDSFATMCDPVSFDPEECLCDLISPKSELSNSTCTGIHIILFSKEKPLKDNLIIMISSFLSGQSILGAFLFRRVNRLLTS